MARDIRVGSVRVVAAVVGSNVLRKWTEESACICHLSFPLLLTEYLSYGFFRPCDMDMSEQAWMRSALGKRYAYGIVL